MIPPIELDDTAFTRWLEDPDGVGRSWSNVLAAGFDLVNERDLYDVVNDATMDGRVSVESIWLYRDAEPDMGSSCPFAAVATAASGLRVVSRDFTAVDVKHAVDGTVGAEAVRAVVLFTVEQLNAAIATLNQAVSED